MKEYSSMNGVKRFYLEKENNPNLQEIYKEKGGNFVIENLAIGDILAWETPKTSSSCSMFGNIVSSRDLASKKYADLNQHYLFVYPKDVFLKNSFQNTNIVPTFLPQKQGYVQEHYYASSGIDVQEEYHTPLILDQKAIRTEAIKPLQWSYFAAWYKKLITPKIDENNKVVKAKVVEITQGKTSDLEKAKAIYYYITKNVKYINNRSIQTGMVPQLPSKVISSNLGDCKDVGTLFIAMCKEVNIKAIPILVATDYTYNPSLIPKNIFNHLMVKVTLQKENYFLDLTSSENPFGYHNEIGHAYLEITEDSTTTLQQFMYPSYYKKITKTNGTIKLNEKEATLQVKETKIGDVVTHITD